ncbi:MAG: nucleotidyltransferase family protein [Thermoproteales archaeon]|nr:nucleotidyltransferase family protein [Thermoproteales archaeon]
MKAVILAGGQGKRLRPLTDDRPKPLIPILNRPIIEWQILWLKKHGINEFLICTGYLKEKIMNTLGNGKRLGARIAYLVEEEPLGTGGAVKNAEPFLRNEEGFLLLNGDIITNLDPTRLYDIQGYSVNIALVKMPSPYGIVKIDDSKVVEFLEKPQLPYWINAGIYYIKPEALEYFPEKGDLERTALPRLAEKGKIKATTYDNIFWKSIDVYKDVEETEKHLRQHNHLEE